MLARGERANAWCREDPLASLPFPDALVILTERITRAGNPSPCVRSNTEVLPDATRGRLVARTSESEANPNSFFVQRKTEVPGSGKIVVTGITTMRNICRAMERQPRSRGAAENKRGGILI